MPQGRLQARHVHVAPLQRAGVIPRSGLPQSASNFRSARQLNLPRVFASGSRDDMVIRSLEATAT